MTASAAGANAGAGDGPGEDDEDHDEDEDDAGVALRLIATGAPGAAATRSGPGRRGEDVAGEREDGEQDARARS